MSLLRAEAKLREYIQHFPDGAVTFCVKLKGLPDELRLFGVDYKIRLVAEGLTFL